MYRFKIKFGNYGYYTFCVILPTGQLFTTAASILQIASEKFSAPKATLADVTFTSVQVVEEGEESISSSPHDYWSVYPIVQRVLPVAA